MVLNYNNVKSKLFVTLEQSQFQSALLIWQHTTGGGECVVGCTEELSMLFDNQSVYIDWICNSTVNVEKRKKVQSLTALKRVKTDVSHTKPSLAS